MYTVYSSVKEIGRGGTHHETAKGKSEEIRAKEREDRKDPASDHDHEPRDCDDVKQDRPQGSQLLPKGRSFFYPLQPRKKNKKTPQPKLRRSPLFLILHPVHKLLEQLEHFFI